MVQPARLKGLHLSRPHLPSDHGSFGSGKSWGVSASRMSTDCLTSSRNWSITTCFNTSVADRASGWSQRPEELVHLGSWLYLGVKCPGIQLTRCLGEGETTAIEDLQCSLCATHSNVARNTSMSSLAFIFVKRQSTSLVGSGMGKQLLVPGTGFGALWLSPSSLAPVTGWPPEHDGHPHGRFNIFLCPHSPPD